MTLKLIYQESLELPSEALGLVSYAKEHSKKLGISFHVGSQCMHKISYSKGILEIGNIIKNQDYA